MKQIQIQMVTKVLRGRLHIWDEKATPRRRIGVKIRFETPSYLRSLASAQAKYEMTPLLLHTFLYMPLQPKLVVFQVFQSDGTFVGRFPKKHNKQRRKVVYVL
jgi:hypothetical protein